MNQPSLLWTPVVMAQEMIRLEALAMKEGCSEEKFMAQAGKQVAMAALERGPKRVALLIGKGNNGGDAYAAGIYLLEQGVRVRALTLTPQEQCSKWNRVFGERFRKKRGKIEELAGATIEEDLVLDGLLGTGLQGKVTPVTLRAIEMANASGKI